MNIQTRHLFIIYTALTAVVLYPVFSVLVPPLVDYPSHLARFHILNAWNITPELQQNYVIDFALRPNMALDLLMLPLGRIFPIYDAGRLAIAASMLTLVGGTMALRKVLYGSIGIWPILTYLLIYNFAFYWGFLEYLFTAGLALLAFSFWISMRKKSIVLRLIISAFMSIFLYIGHIFGLFTYALLVMGYEIWITKQRYRTWRSVIEIWTVYSFQFIVPGILFLYWIVSNQTLGDPITLYGGIIHKLWAIYSPVFFGNFVIDLITAIFLWVVFVACRRNAAIAFAPALKYPVILLVVAAILMPNYLMSVWGTDFRLPPIIGCVIVAGIQQKGPIRLPLQLILALAIPVLIARMAVISIHWQDYDQNFREFREATKVIEPGASLLVILDVDATPAEKRLLETPQYIHLDALAVIERSTFNPLLVTGVYTVDASNFRQQISSETSMPLTPQTLVESADEKASPERLRRPISRYVRNYWIGWPETFDYVLSIRFRNLTNPYPARLKKIKTGSFFDIFRVMLGKPD